MRKTNGGQHALDASVEFYDEENENGVALASLEGLKFLPRIGDTVMLPKPDNDSKRELYEVTDVNHNFCREMAGKLPSEVRLLSINVTVKRAS